MLREIRFPLGHTVKGLLKNVEPNATLELSRILLAMDTS